MNVLKLQTPSITDNTTLCNFKKSLKHKADVTIFTQHVPLMKHTRALLVIRVLLVFMNINVFVSCSHNFLRELNFTHFTLTLEFFFCPFINIIFFSSRLATEIYNPLYSVKGDTSFVSSAWDFPLSVTDFTGRAMDYVDCPLHLQQCRSSFVLPNVLLQNLSECEGCNVICQRVNVRWQCYITASWCNWS